MLLEEELTLNMYTSRYGSRGDTITSPAPSSFRNKDHNSLPVRYAHCSGLKLIFSGNVNKTATALKHNVVNKLNTITGHYKSFAMVFNETIKYKEHTIY